MHSFVHSCVSPLSLLGNGSLKIPPIVARRLGRNVTAVTNTRKTREELLDASFSMWPVSYQGKYAITSSQNFLLFVYSRPSHVQLTLRVLKFTISNFKTLSCFGFHVLFYTSIAQHVSAYLVIKKCQEG
jgi:hypothetical protein